jgi:hypothetical protein
MSGELETLRQQLAQQRLQILAADFGGVGSFRGYIVSFLVGPCRRPSNLVILDQDATRISSLTVIFVAVSLPPLLSRFASPPVRFGLTEATSNASEDCPKTALAMPIASESTATAGRTGDLRGVRKGHRRSCSIAAIDRCTARRERGYQKSTGLT